MVSCNFWWCSTAVKFYDNSILQQEWKLYNDTCINNILSQQLCFTTTIAFYWDDGMMKRMEMMARAVLVHVIGEQMTMLLKFQILIFLL